MTNSAPDDSHEPREGHEAPAPRLGPPTDIYLGDETMELLAYGDVEGAKARHDGTPKTVPPRDTMQD